MSSEPFKPSVDELNYFLAATLVVGAAYVTFSGEFNLWNSVFYLLSAGVILSLRELGQRLIAQAMDADTELELSFEGSLVTVFGALIAVLTTLPVIFLFPVSNSFSTQKYEQWGKSTDAIWLKRKFWLVSGGLITLFLGWIVSSLLGFSKVAEAISIFTIFQLLPFDYYGIPTGKLDGATVLRQSGFIWLVYFTIAWISLVLTWV